MRKGPIHIPFDAFDRTAEFLKGAPGVNAMVNYVHLGIKIFTAVSYVDRAYHFESVSEFLQSQDKLWKGYSKVVLPRWR